LFRSPRAVFADSILDTIVFVFNYSLHVLQLVDVKDLPFVFGRILRIHTLQQTFDVLAHKNVGADDGMFTIEQLDMDISE